MFSILYKSTLLFNSLGSEWFFFFAFTKKERTVSNKLYSFERSADQRILKKIIMVSTKTLSSTTFFNINSIKKYYWVPNHHMRIISEGSCDTKDWNNSYWKFSFAITGINFLNIIKTIVLNCNISQYIDQIYWNIYDQINTALLSIRDFF